jgi:hypothetical protein
MQRQHGPQGEPGGDNQWKGFSSYLGELLPDLFAFEGAAEQIGNRLKSEDAYFSGGFEYVAQVAHSSRREKVHPSTSKSLTSAVLLALCRQTDGGLRVS